MVSFSHLRLLTSVITASILITGCATFRPMPTHGGGKRFDEEQRVVSAAVRHAMTKMDLSKLRKRKVAIEVTSLATSGGSDTLEYPGLKALYAHTGANPLSLSYNLKPKILSKKNLTRQDIEYVEQTLVTQLRVEGYQVTSPEDADLYLVALVDVLGTNHSRTDFGLGFRDRLAASYEMTYYVVDAKTQKLVSPAKSVGSLADYIEYNIRFTPIGTHKTRLMDLAGSQIGLPTSHPHQFVNTYTAAPIADLQLQAPKEKKKKKKKKRGGKKRKNKNKSPDERIDVGPDDKLLPPLDLGPDGGILLPDADKKDTKEDKKAKIKELSKQVRAHIRKGEFEEAQQALDDMKLVNPKAGAIKKLGDKLEAAKKAASSAPTTSEIPAPTKGRTTDLHLKSMG